MPTRGRPAKLTPLQLEVVREIVGSGDASFREVAPVYCCHPETLRKQLRGLTVSQRLPKQLVEQILAMRRAGATETEISAVCEISKAAAWKVCKRHGVSSLNAAPVYCAKFKDMIRSACDTACVREVASRFRLCPSTVQKWLKGRPREYVWRNRNKPTHFNFGAAR